MDKKNKKCIKIGLKNLDKNGKKMGLKNAPAAVEQFPAAAPAAFYTNPYIAPGDR